MKQFWGGVGVGSKITPSHCLKLVRNMLEIWNLVHKYTDIYTSENIPFSIKPPLPLILLMSAFYRKPAFLAKIVPLLKAIVWELCSRFFSSVFSFLVSFPDYASKIPASVLGQIGYISEKWQWRHSLPTRLRHQFFWRCFVSLVKISYWSTFMSISSLVHDLIFILARKL